MQNKLEDVTECPFCDCHTLRTPDELDEGMCTDCKIDANAIPDELLFFTGRTPNPLAVMAATEREQAADALTHPNNCDCFYCSP